jgi:hypothetical protein
MKPPLIAVDLGGTIEDSWQSKWLWFAARGIDLGPWPRSRLEVIEAIGGQEALYERMAAEVYSDGKIISREPVEGVAAGLHTLAQQFRVAIVSSRTELQRLTTCAWLQRCGLMNLVAEIVLLGSDGNKLEWCQHTGAVALIDDDIRHLEPTNDFKAITRIHFAARLHGTLPSHRNIRVATTWPEILCVLQRELEFREPDTSAARESEIKAFAPGQ